MERSRGRRIPTYSVKGPTEEATERLRLRFYLEELGRQADLFGRSFADALDAVARDDPTDAWRHVQSAIFAAIVVNRLLTNSQPRPRAGWALKEAQKAASWRVRQLRRLVGLPDPDRLQTPLYTVSKVRDSLEHVDERIDRALWSEGAIAISDWYISGGDFVMSLEPTDNSTPVTVGLRAFHPESGFLFFDNEQLDLFRLDIDMLKLRHNAQEAQKELDKEISGRLMFGGGRLMTIDERLVQNRFEEWKRERARIVAELGGNAPLVPFDLGEKDDGAG